MLLTSLQLSCNLQSCKERVGTNVHPFARVFREGQGLSRNVLEQTKKTSKTDLDLAAKRYRDLIQDLGR